MAGTPAPGGAEQPSSGGQPPTNGPSQQQPQQAADSMQRPATLHDLAQMGQNVRNALSGIDQRLETLENPPPQAREEPLKDEAEEAAEIAAVIHGARVNDARDYQRAAKRAAEERGEILRKWFAPVAKWGTKALKLGALGLGAAWMGGVGSPTELWDSLKSVSPELETVVRPEKRPGWMTNLNRLLDPIGVEVTPDEIEYQTIGFFDPGGKFQKGLDGMLHFLGISNTTVTEKVSKFLGQSLTGIFGAAPLGLKLAKGAALASNPGGWASILAVPAGIWAGRKALQLTRNVYKDLNKAILARRKMAAEKKIVDTKLNEQPWKVRQAAKNEIEEDYRTGIKNAHLQKLQATAAA